MAENNESNITLSYTALMYISLIVLMAIAFTGVIAYVTAYDNLSRSHEGKNELTEIEQLMVDEAKAVARNTITELESNFLENRIDTLYEYKSQRNWIALGTNYGDRISIIVDSYWSQTDDYLSQGNYPRTVMVATKTIDGDVTYVNPLTGRKY